MRSIQSYTNQLIIGLLVLSLYLSPYFFFGEDTYVYALDNLDGVVPAFRFLARSGYCFAPANEMVPGHLYQQLRACYGTEFNLQYLWYAALPPFAAYVCNVIIVHVVAYLGAFALLHAVLQNTQLWLKNAAALCFALLPFWYAGGLSVAAQPLLLLAMYRISKGEQRVWHYLSVLLYVVYAQFFWAGIFFITAMACLLLYFILTKNQHLKALLTWFTLWLLLSLAAEHKTIELMLFQDFESQRSSYHIQFDTSFGALFSDFTYYLKYAHYQALTLHLGPLLLLIPLLFTLKKERKAQLSLVFGIALFVAITLLSSKFVKLFFTEHFSPQSFFYQFDFSRVNTLLPLLLLLIIAAVLHHLASPSKRSMHLFAAILCLQVMNCFYSSAAIRKTLVHAGVPMPQRYWYDQSHEYVPYTSFRTFYMEDAFSDLKQSDLYKDLSQHYCISIGFHPAVSLYHGLRTMDGYMNIYAQSYKDFVMQVSAQELSKNSNNFSQLRDWGNRCYFFAADAQYDFVQHKHLPATQLDFRFDLLAQKGCKYVLSVGELLNPALHLVFASHRRDADLYVYEF